MEDNASVLDSDKEYIQYNTQYGIKKIKKYLYFYYIIFIFLYEIILELQ